MFRAAMALTQNGDECAFIGPHLLHGLCNNLVFCVGLGKALRVFLAPLASAVCDCGL